MKLLFAVLAIASLICFIIGIIKPKLIVFWTKSKNRKWAFVYLGAYIIFSFISLSYTPAPGDITSSAAANAPSTSAVSHVKASSASHIKVDKTFESGFYTVGVDIPAGTYNFKAVSGKGYVSTTNGEIRVLMGTSDNGSKYSPTFSDADLVDGEVLQINVVTLEITSDNASAAPLNLRNQKITETKQFGPGNYTAGKDFSAGTYDLKVISGSGSVTAGKPSGAITYHMGTDSDSLNSFNNVILNDGAMLNIKGITITLTPSK